MFYLSKRLDRVASELESRGLVKLAAELDVVANTLEKTSFLDMDTVLSVQHRISPWKVHFDFGDIELLTDIDNKTIAVSLTPKEEGIVRVDFTGAGGHEEAPPRDIIEIQNKASILKMMSMLADTLQEKYPVQAELMREHAVSHWKSLVKRTWPTKTEHKSLYMFPYLLEKLGPTLPENAKEEFSNVLEKELVSLWDQFQESGDQTIDAGDPATTIAVVGLGIVEGLRWLFRNKKVHIVEYFEIDSKEEYTGDTRRAHLYKRALPKTLSPLLGVSFKQVGDKLYQLIPPLMKAP